MKKRGLMIAVLSAGLVLTGCNGGGNKPTPPTPVVEDEYKVAVESCPTGITYTLSAEKAKEGDDITFHIDSVASGIEITSVRLYYVGELTPEADGVTYKFKMPAFDAIISIAYKVTGDVIANGDVSFIFNETSAGSGVFEAKNVEVPSSIINAYAGFDVTIGATKLKALDLDETRSFGDISSMGFGSYVFKVARGSTYDFIYDTTRTVPLSIKRVGVTDLPNSETSLSSILVSSYAIRSEPAMYVDDLLSINYERRDTTSGDIVWQEFNWKAYKDNTTYGTVSDKVYPEKEDMVVYRHYDETNKTYSVVDTYSLYTGKLKVNNDRFRELYNGYGEYSARYDVIETDDYGHRFAKNIDNVSRELRSTSHNPAYLMESEIQYAYRTHFPDDSDYVTYADSKIESTLTATGFTTTIDTTKEVLTDVSSTSTVNEAEVFAVTLTFDARGALTGVDYRKTTFTADEWDFANHVKKTGKSGSIKEMIKATYTYGKPTETCTFDVSPYFITSLDKIKYVDPLLADKTTPTDPDSYMGPKGYLYLQDNEGNRLKGMEIAYTPSTALDLWQYGPVASSNEAVIAHQATDVYYQMSAITEGTATVTFTNHVSTPSIQGATKDITVHVFATGELREFSFDQVWGDDSYAEHDTWNTATVHANGTYKFRIKCTQETAAFVYTAVSSNTSLLKITSPASSRDLIIDTTGAKNITENTLVNITFQSDRYATGFGPTVFNIYIMPAQANPLGTWRHENTTIYPETYMYFTEEAYESKQGYFKGSIIDKVYSETGLLQGTNSYYFYYKYNGAKIDATIYNLKIEVEVTTLTPTVSDMYFDFYYDSPTGRLGVFLAVTESEDDVVYYDCIFGNTDDTYTIPQGYSPFVKVS